MNFFDELDLDKLEAALNNSIIEPTAASAPAAQTENAATEQRFDAQAGADSVSQKDTADLHIDDISSQQDSGAPDSADKATKHTNKSKGKVSKKEDEGSPMSLYDWVQCIVYALVAGVLIFIFVGRAINIEGASMYPTLHNGDEVIISNLFYSPRAGDVVVLRTLSYGPKPLVKRIIATEGETVDIDFEAGIVYVDGTALEEDYVNAPIYFRDSFDGPVTVPEGCVFVLGDNRNESSDSRHESIGMIDERCIIGKVVCVLLPAYEADGERNWSRIGEVA